MVVWNSFLEFTFYILKAWHWLICTSSFVSWLYPIKRNNFIVFPLAFLECCFLLTTHSETVKKGLTAQCCLAMACFSHGLTLGCSNWILATEASILTFLEFLITISWDSLLLLADGLIEGLPLLFLLTILGWAISLSFHQTSQVLCLKGQSHLSQMSKTNISCASWK